jgi:hypothetical protein
MAIKQDNIHESTLWLLMGLLQIKCIKFYQVTYFDATSLMYN